MDSDQLLRSTPTGQRLLIVGLLLATGALGYLRLTTSFAPYDDEGYVMVSLQSFMDDRPLYDATYSQYGPAYFYLSSWFHRLTGLPISHDTARLKMLAVWILTAGAAGWATYRLSGQRWLGLIVYVAAWFHLDRLGFEPGHPQDLCFAAIALSMLVACKPAVSRRHQVLQAVSLGALAGVAAMTKINVGVFLLIIATTAAAFQAKPGRLRIWLLMVTAVVAALLPVVIAKHHTLSFSGMQLPATVVAGWLGLAIVFSRAQSGVGEVATPELADSTDRGPEPETRSATDYGGVIGTWISFAATIALFCGLALADGTSPSGLYFGLIGQHRGVIDRVYEHPPFHPFAFVVSAIGAVMAWFITRSTTSPERKASVRKVLTFASITLLAGVGLRYVTDSVTLIDHGANDRGHAGLLLSVLPGFAWLALLRRRGSERQFANTWLAVSCVVLPMCPYPVPGTQTAMASLTLLVLLFVVLRDAIVEWQPSADDRRFCTRAVAVIGVACSVCLGVRGHELGKTFRNHEPLGLAGAEHLRLEPGFVAQTNWTIQRLREHNASTFFCVPSGHNSLFRWSQIAPPNGQNATVWESLLRDEQQNEIIASLRRHERPVIIWNTGEAAPAISSGPLRSYIEANFETVAKRGTIEIRTRRTATVARSPIDPGTLKW